MRRSDDDLRCKRRRIVPYYMLRWSFTHTCTHIHTHTRIHTYRESDLCLEINFLLFCVLMQGQSGAALRLLRQLVIADVRDDKKRRRRKKEKRFVLNEMLQILLNVHRCFQPKNVAACYNYTLLAFSLDVDYVVEGAYSRQFARNKLQIRLVTRSNDRHRLSGLARVSRADRHRA